MIGFFLGLGVGFGLFVIYKKATKKVETSTIGRIFNFLK